MNTTTLLEWWHKGAWHQIGWEARSPLSVLDLRKHGAALAANGGHYRLVQPSVYADAPPAVIHEYPVISEGVQP